MGERMTLEIAAEAAGVDLEAETMRRFGVTPDALTGEQRRALLNAWPLTLRQIVYACARRQGVEMESPGHSTSE